MLPKLARLSVLVSLLSCPSLLKADSTLNFPRLSIDPNTLTGIAIVNPTAQDAVVTLTAYGPDGVPLVAAGVTNPAQVTVPAVQQVAVLTSTLFGTGLDASTVGWFQATSPADGLTGFFLVLNSSLTSMDGADLPETSQKLIFNQIRVDQGFSTEIDIVNPGSAPANAVVQLKGTSFPPLPGSVTIPAQGVLRFDAAS